MTPEKLQEAQQTLDVLTALKNTKENLGKNTENKLDVIIESDGCKNRISVSSDSYEAQLFVEYLDSMIEVLEKRFTDL